MTVQVVVANRYDRRVVLSAMPRWACSEAQRHVEPPPGDAAHQGPILGSTGIVFVVRELAVEEGQDGDEYFHPYKQRRLEHRLWATNGVLQVVYLNLFLPTVIFGFSTFGLSRIYRDVAMESRLSTTA
jgi:hypothetical protein